MAGPVGGGWATVGFMASTSLHLPLVLAAHTPVQSAKGGPAGPLRSAQRSCAALQGAPRGPAGGQGCAQRAGGGNSEVLTMNPTFSHHKLDCYRLSLELLVLCERLVRQAPQGHGKIKDNLQRSAEGIPLLVAEGANRWTPGMKRQRFIEARGETGEVAAALEVGVLVGVFPKDGAHEAMVIADRRVRPGGPAL